MKFDGLLPDLFFSQLALRDVMSNRNILIRFPFGIQIGNYRRIDPVDAAILGAITKLALPDVPRSDGGP